MISPGPIDGQGGYSVKVPDVYLARHCIGCEEAPRLAGEINQGVPGLRARVIMRDEMADGDLLEIPATAAYFLDGQLLFLGNLHLEDLMSRLAPLQTHQGENRE